MWRFAGFVMIGCSGPDPLGVVRVSLGGTPVSAHFLTDEVAVVVVGQDLVQVDTRGGDTEVLLSGVRGSYPLAASDRVLVHAANGALVEVDLAGAPASDPLATAGGAGDFARFMAAIRPPDPRGSRTAN